MRLWAQRSLCTISIYRNDADDVSSARPIDAGEFDPYEKGKEFPENFADLNYSFCGLLIYLLIKYDRW